MKKIKVLFLCVHNSTRSQMAEAYLNKFGEGQFEAESAGFEPGKLNPIAVDVMKEEGIDISGNKVDSVYEFFKQRRFYGYVITVCDTANNQKCPVFPGVPKRIHWNIEDPSSFKGSHEKKLEKTRIVRDEIKKRVKGFIESMKSK
jgi:arsenate reductase